MNERVLSPELERLHLCYIFAKVYRGEVAQSPEQAQSGEEARSLEGEVHLLDDGAQSPDEAQSLEESQSPEGKAQFVDEGAQSQQEAAQIARADEAIWKDLEDTAKAFVVKYEEDLPTTVRTVVFGRVESPENEYEFFMRFRYRTLEDVAETVMATRTYFKNKLARTLTMLEFGRWNAEKETLSETASARTARNFGLLLVQINAAVVTLTGIMGLASSFCAPGVTCVEVLGPFDYVLEFEGDAEAKMLELSPKFGSKCLRVIPLDCRQFGN